MAPPKGTRRHILDYNGEKRLRAAIELMRRAVEMLDTVCNEHMVEDWVITREE